MACSEDQSLGKYLEAIGKAFNACGKINKIGAAISKAVEELKTVQNDTDVINVTLTSIREFRDVMGSCIGIEESLNGSIFDIEREHLECLKYLKEISKSGELSGQQVERISGSLKKLVENFEQFGQKMHDFIKCTNDLQSVSVRVKDEATREAEKVEQEASSSRLKAKGKSVVQWAARIATLGLITYNSRFQESVEANNDKYQRAEELDGISSKFIEAKKLLDIAVRTTDSVAEQFSGEPVKLTEDVIGVIKSVLQRYQQLADAQHMVLQKENTIIEKDQVIEEKSDEIERLNRQLEELTNNQGQKARRDGSECQKRQLRENFLTGPVQDAQKDENERLKRQLEEMTRNQELKAQKDENERLKRQLEELTSNNEGGPAT